MKPLGDKEKISHQEQLGFTLIELSIVLIIIGLIVGGVLVGQDLIQAAQVRATIAQIEKYNSAINTFRSKFNSIPGDILPANAAAFGLSADSTNSWGNGNGLIDGSVASPAAWSQEAGWLWVQLSQASLLDSAFSTNWTGAAPLAVTSASVTTTWPISRLSNGSYVNVGSASGINYWMISGISAAATTGAITTTANITPIQMYNMDSKLDDGNPLTGTVQAHATSGSSITTFNDPPSAGTTSTNSVCVVGDTAGTLTTDTYNRNINSGGNTALCEARFRFN